jgi:hypothetical protein
MTNYSMQDDLEKYPRFFFDELTREILPESEMESRNPILFLNYQRHHFVEKTIRKNNPAEYKRFEHLQKIIFVPAEMNYDLSSGMGEENFFNKWGINKFDVIFNKDKYFEK